MACWNTSTTDVLEITLTWVSGYRRSHRGRKNVPFIRSITHAPDQTYIRLQQLHCLFDLATSPPFWIVAWIETIFMEFRRPKPLVNLHGCLSAGTGSIPVSSAISLREIRPAARTLASRSRYEGSSPSSPAMSGGGIAAGASGLQPDDASSTFAVRSMRKSSSGEDATLPTRSTTSLCSVAQGRLRTRARVRVPPSAADFVSKFEAV
jgi:hypothetical protein